MQTLGVAEIVMTILAARKTMMMRVRQARTCSSFSRAACA